MGVQPGPRDAYLPIDLPTYLPTYLGDAYPGAGSPRMQRARS